MQYVNELEVDVPIDVVDSPDSGAVETQMVQLSVFYSSRDYTDDEVKNCVVSNLPKITIGDLTAVDPKLLIVDRANSERVRLFLSNIVTAICDSLT